MRAAALAGLVWAIAQTGSAQMIQSDVLHDLPAPVLAETIVVEKLAPPVIPTGPPRPEGGGWNFFGGTAGSKQPQDFGVNANLGARLSAEYAGPLWHEAGIGFQVGTSVTFSDNAVRVFEVLNEETTRFQNHTTLGLFRRGTSQSSSKLGRVGWALAYDHLYQEAFDTVTLDQFRGRLTYHASHRDELGFATRLTVSDDEAEFNEINVTLRSINQHEFFWRHFFASGVQTTASIGFAERHGQNNVVTGNDSAFGEAFVVGADFLAPLAGSFAIYGETNLTFPADTGTVDAFLGLAWYPGRSARSARRGRYDAAQPLASDTTFSVDLLDR